MKGKFKKDKQLGLIDDNVFDELYNDPIYQELERKNEELDKSIDEKYEKVSVEGINYLRYCLRFGKLDFRFSGLDYIEQ